jgi:hypothetical protein
MNRIEPWRAWTFVGTLAVAAFIINGTQRRPVERPTESLLVERPRTLPTTREETPISPEELARRKEEEKSRFRARYLQQSQLENPTQRIFAVAAVKVPGVFSGPLSATITSTLSSSAASSIQNLFTHQFIVDGLFDEIFGGNLRALTDLELAKRIKTLVLARESVEYSRTPELENVITASMEVEVLAFDVASLTESGAWIFRANGAGFREPDARALAEERLIKQIKTDTKFSAFSVNSNTQ